MAIQDIAMGTYGTIRIEIIQNSQNQAANTSNITIRGLIRKSNASSAIDNNNACYSKLTGTTAQSIQTDFNIPARDTAWRTMVTKTVDVLHDVNGYYTATGTFQFGPTETKAFGSSKKSVGPLSMSLTRIPKVPAAPATPTASLAVPTTVNVSWSTPDNMGSEIVRYEVGYSTIDNTSALTVVSAGVSLSKAITGLPVGTTQYFFVRAINGVGASPWSPISGAIIPNVPTKITERSMVYVSPRSLNVVWVAPASPNAPIDAGLVRWNIDNNPYSTYGGGEASVLSASNFYQITELANATTYYVFAYVHNSQGWSLPSDPLTYTIPNVPDGMVVPTLLFTPPTTVTVSFVSPGNGGSPITGYSIEYADNAVFTNPVQINAAYSPKIITNLIPGKTYWFRVKAINAQGNSNPSPSTSLRVLSGPRVYHEGKYKTTIAYVYDDDFQWRIAIPFRADSLGGWNNAGG